MATRKTTDEQKALCTDLFLSHVMDRLKSTHRPWAMPRALGGLGLRGVGSGPNYSQRLVTAYLLMQADVKRYITCPKTTLHTHSRYVNQFAQKLETKLGCEYREFSMEREVEVERRTYNESLIDFYKFGDDVFEVSLDDCFLGESVEKIKVKGEDGYAKLMKEVHKFSKENNKNGFLNPVSDDKLQELWELVYCPRRLDEKILFF
jgi:hypothetical protein